MRNGMVQQDTPVGKHERAVVYIVAQNQGKHTRREESITWQRTKTVFSQMKSVRLLLLPRHNFFVTRGSTLSLPATWPCVRL